VPFGVGWELLPGNAGTGPYTTLPPCNSQALCAERSRHALTVDAQGTAGAGGFGVAGLGLATGFAGDGAAGFEPVVAGAEDAEDVLGVVAGAEEAGGLVGTDGPGFPPAAVPPPVPPVEQAASTAAVDNVATPARILFTIITPLIRLLYV
jgi:hypothetical protein